MDPSVTLFVSMFTTLLAIINPLEAIPVFLGLMQGKNDAEHKLMARKACLYALLLMFFFLVFGNLLLRLFDVPLSMVRVVGGVILMRIGFELFAPSANNNLIPAGGAADHVWPRSDCHRDRPDLNHQEFRARPDIVFSVSLAIIATMLVIYLSLVYAKAILKKLGPQGLDAATRIVGFFVAAMGVGLIFHGMVEFLQSYGVLLGGVAGH